MCFFAVDERKHPGVAVAAPVLGNFLDLMFVVVDLTPVRRRPVTRRSTPLCVRSTFLLMTSDSFSAMMTIATRVHHSPTVACVAILELLPSALPLLMRGGAE
jgi:hypothetical protein